MPYNGSGTFTLVAGNPTVTGTVIATTWGNPTMSDFASGLTNCVTRDGQSAPTTNLPMGGFSFTNLGAPSTMGQALTWGTAASVTTLTVTTSATVPAGAAATPSFIISTATNGFFAPAAAQIGVATAGVQRVVFDNLGVTSYAVSGTLQTSLTAGILTATNNPRLVLRHTESTQLTDINFSGSVAPTGSISVGGTAAITVSNARNIAIAAPASGIALTVTGHIALADTVSRIIPGATSLLLRDNANANSNVAITDAGAVTIRNGLTVSASGAAVTGNSMITGRFQVGSSGTQWEVDASNRLLNPGDTQPSFRARRGDSGQAAGNTIIFDTEIFDQGGNYNPATGEFTAPVAGLYEFSSVVNFVNLSGSTVTGAELTLNVGGTLILASVGADIPTGKFYTVVIPNTLVRLTAGQVVTVSSTIALSAGFSTNSKIYAVFSGSLRH